MSKETLSKSLTGVIITFIVFFCASVIYVVHQNNESQQQSIVNLTDKIDTTLLNLQQQVQNLASNDLIINSIIDNNTSNHYLPLLFRSLKLSNSVETSIVFTDHSGEIITGNNTLLHQKYASDFNWQATVLSSGLPYFEFSDRGVFIAAPVLMSALPQGAIVAYMSNLQPLVSNIVSNSTLIYINKNNQVLYSSNNQLIANGSFYSEKHFLLWSKNTLPYLTGNMVLIEPPLSAYGKLFWLTIIIVLSLLFMFFGLISNIKSTAKYASSSMQELQKILAEAITQNGNIQVNQKDNEPFEFIEIRQEFNLVLKNLFDQTISLEKFTRVINSLGEVLLVLDAHKNIILNNNSFTQLCNSIGAEMPQELSKIIPEQYLTVAAENSNFNMRYQLSGESSSKHSIILQWNASHYRDNQGEILGVILVGKDVSLANQLESELLIKNQAIDEAQTSIIIIDAVQSKNPIIYANKAFCKLTGYSLDEIIGTNCRFMQGPNTQASDIAKISKAINDKKAITITLTNYKKDGGEFKNELTVNPISNKQGDITHFLGIQLDVTAREATANYLKLAKQKAEESTQLKSEFLASMSHEIRTPMNGVIGMLDLLLRSPLNKEQHCNAEIAKDSAHALLTIIDDILDFSKIESGKFTIEHIAFDLLSLLTDVVKTHAQQANDKEIALILEMSDVELSLVTGDAGRIRQILNNLISNAIKFTQKGEVVITAKLTKQAKHRATLQCEIVDTGIGIAANRLEQIFDSFTQADYSTTRLYGGTGLGLAITSKLCQLMQGAVKVTSEEKVGSCFSFIIQLSIGEPVEKLNPCKLINTNNLKADANEQSAAAGSKPSHQSQQYKQPFTLIESYKNNLSPQSQAQQKPRVLLVEDNLTNQLVAKKVLFELGCEITIVNNGKEAIRMLNKVLTSFTLVFMDCQMPVLDGYQATQKIRAGAAGDHNKIIPIIAMTANAMKGDKEKCLLHGMDDYVSKPINIEVLREKITLWSSA